MGWRKIRSSTYRCSTCTYPPELVDTSRQMQRQEKDSPLKINSLNDESQRRTNSGNIFFHNLLHNGGFAGIV